MLNAPSRESGKIRQPEARRYRTLFLSDIHLGTKGCQAKVLLDFLKNHDAETIYLVGHIADGWRLKSAWYWPQTHNDVVQKLLRKGRKGTRIVYVRWAVRLQSPKRLFAVRRRPCGH